MLFVTMIEKGLSSSKLAYDLRVLNNWLPAATDIRYYIYVKKACSSCDPFQSCLEKVEFPMVYG